MKESTGQTSGMSYISNKDLSFMNVIVKLQSFLVVIKSNQTGLNPVTEKLQESTSFFEG